jgi:hypothetical protein
MFKAMPGEASQKIYLLKGGKMLTNCTGMPNPGRRAGKEVTILLMCSGNPLGQIIVPVSFHLRENQGIAPHFA